MHIEGVEEYVHVSVFSKYQHLLISQENSVRHFAGHPTLNISTGYPVMMYICTVFDSIVVSIPRCHRGDPGSIPGRAGRFLSFFAPPRGQNSLLSSAYESQRAGAAFCTIRLSKSQRTATQCPVDHETVQGLGFRV